MSRTPILALVAVLLAAPARGQEVSGRVFELVGGKRAASADAFVIVHWTGTRPGLHYESVCLQAAIARTDEHGRFALAEPPPLRSTFLVFGRDPAVAIYKPGFDERHELRVAARRREFFLTPTGLDARERGGFAESMADLGCRDDKGMLVPLTDPQAVLPAFRAALASESPPKPRGEIEIRVLQRAGPLPAAR